MTRRSITSLAAVAVAAVGTLSLAGPVAAAAPAKRHDAKRAVVAKRPPSLTVAATVKGQPLSGGPGMATGAECRGYADAVNGLVDQAQEDVLGGGGSADPNAGPVIEAILTAGQARGCAFTVS